MLRLKKASQADAQLIVQLQKSAFQALYDKYQDADNPVHMTVEGVLKRMQMQGSSHYLIEVDGEVIGFIRLKKQADSLRVAPIAILPDYQGKGYGRIAMLAAEKLYSQVSSFTLNTIRQEGKLCQFYESLGYVTSGTGLHLQEGMDLVEYVKVVKLAK